MRWTIAGLFLLTMLSATPAAVAQATGEVQSIGFNGYYRPDAWVPMVVRIKPDPAMTEAGNFQIKVYQHDLDGDRAVYVRPITLNAPTTDALRTQPFWMYFLPEPVNKGLADTSLRDLNKEVVVFLCDAKGKQLLQLPITSTLNDVDPYAGQGRSPRATKLVLAVSATGGEQPPMGTLAAAGVMVGLSEDVELVNLRMDDLPENPLGYEAVDAVVWLDGDPAALEAKGHGLSALQDYVRCGGQLVVTQPTQNWQETAGFGDLLPVDVQGVATKTDFEPLRSMAHAPDMADFQPADPQPGILPYLAQGADARGDAWSRVRPPFQMARATARPGAVVEDWIDWKQDGTYADATPYLCRRAAGLGQVTWVAQPLTVDAQPANANGWAYVWLHVMGWRSDAYLPPPQSAASGSSSDPAVKAREDRYHSSGSVDLGFPLIGGSLLNLGSKGAWLIVLAIGFFVVYWLAAGPGTYAYLMTKKRQALSWFFFAAAAGVATAVTVGVVKLVLRGPPEVRHLSMVRVAPGQPTVVYSRFGLYIPRDGDQTIELENTDPKGLSYLSALAEHPAVLGDVSEFPAPLDYDVPVRDVSSADAPLLTVPYRSSLKKFQARWVGDLPAKIGAGGLALDLDNGRMPIKGTLTNDTGHDLTDVYFAFHVDADRDWMVYLPTWAKGTPLDLKKQFTGPFAVSSGEGKAFGVPGQNKVLSDQIVPAGYLSDRESHGWANVWFAQFRGHAGNDGPEQANPIDAVYPVLSVFDRLPPMPNYRKGGNGATANEFGDDRVDLLCRGARLLDAGKSLAAGQLLVLATVKGPLPIPVQVDGDPVAGDGVTLYQFVLPIDRGTVDRPPAKPGKGSSAER